jgi:transcriptional regulator with XRE-family HTH domain
MTHVSERRDALPPKTAPLAKRLAAAMAGSQYETARALARALGTDGSLVGKWLSGDVREIKAQHHLRKLPQLLGTPANYFQEHRTRTDHLEELEAEVARMGPILAALVDRVESLESQASREARRGDGPR